MPELPPIPTPAAQRWKEFKIRGLPLAIFVCALLEAAYLWRENVAPSNLPGEVESIRADVTSPKPGMLAQLNLTRLQPVKAGDVVAQVITTDPRILQASLAVIQAEIKLLQVNLQPIIDQQRYALNYNRMQLDWMEQRVQLASDRVKLQLAENDFRRMEELFKTKVVSEKVFDQARANKEQLNGEVEDRVKLVQELEGNLKQLRLRGNSSEEKWTLQDVMQASIAVQEEKLRLAEAELSPIALRVPIDGMVSIIHHHSGEAVNAGVPIVTVSTLTSDRIIGYLRQPLTIEPKVGMVVQVRARSFKRPVSEAKILQVGTQMELINPTLLPPALARLPEMGLPILVSLPSALKLLPGEVVDLTIRPSKN